MKKLLFFVSVSISGIAQSMEPSEQPQKKSNSFLEQTSTSKMRLGDMPKAKSFDSKAKPNIKPTYKGKEYNGIGSPKNELREKRGTSLEDNGDKGSLKNSYQNLEKRENSETPPKVIVTNRKPTPTPASTRLAPFMPSIVETILSKKVEQKEE